MPTPCPLAVDPDGHPIELPESSAAWRVRRKTGGRPRLVLGVDKQPVQLPLSYSLVDLEDILAPAEYLLDVVDAKGDAVGITIAVSLAALRNADGPPEESSPAADSISSMLPTTASETRLVLEANVRATQMAFLHNQKTLELGLRMAETLRDGVRVMAESQADWIKAMASARGFFRNAAPLQLPPPPPPPANDRDDEEDDDDDDYEPPPQPTWVDQLTPVIGPLVNSLVQSFMSRPKDAPSGRAPRVKLEARDVLDWRRIKEKQDDARAKEAEAAAAEAAEAELPPIDLAAAAHFVAIQQRLTEDEAAMARAIGANLSPGELRIWMHELQQLSVDDAVAKIRAFLNKPAA
jgi:hypothetical protein